MIFVISREEVMGGSCFDQELEVNMDSAHLSAVTFVVFSPSHRSSVSTLNVFILTSTHSYLSYSSAAYRTLSELFSATWTVSSPSRAPTLMSSLVSFTAAQCPKRGPWAAAGSHKVQTGPPDVSREQKIYT